jgi:DNA repair protein RecN (Recombination protein N)
VESGKTVTNINKLDMDLKIKEVARMLGGVQLTDLTLKHAAEMISMAQNIKKKLKLDNQSH